MHAAPAKNGTTSVRLGTFGFDAQIPANATIDTVTVSVEWKVDTTSSNATLGSQLYAGGVAKGSELVSITEPTADTTQTYTVSGLSRADLLDGTLEIQVRATRGNSNTAFTASLDTVSVSVDYTVPSSGTAPTYDDNGNMTADGSYGNRTYTYDTLGRLVGVSGNGVTAAYGLDGAGNRWSQTIDSTTTSFDLDLLAANPTVLFDGTNKYLPGAPALGRETGGTWYSGLTDLVGTPLSLVDTAGNVPVATHFDPFGAPRAGYTADAGSFSSVMGYGGKSPPVIPVRPWSCVL